MTSSISICEALDQAMDDLISFNGNEAMDDLISFNGNEAMDDLISFNGRGTSDGISLSSTASNTPVNDIDATLDTMYIISTECLIERAREVIQRVEYRKFVEYGERYRYIRGPFVYSDINAVYSEYYAARMEIPNIYELALLTGNARKHFMKSHDMTDHDFILLLADNCLYRGQNPICITNILFKLSCSIFEAIDASDYDYSSDKAFRKSLYNIIDVLLKSMRSKKFIHRCSSSPSKCSSNVLLLPRM
jgi:hypothetical protein